jgi:hypothetical protein
VATHKELQCKVEAVMYASCNYHYLFFLTARAV